jgi:hypothetical protein
MALLSGAAPVELMPIFWATSLIVDVKTNTINMQQYFFMINLF